MTDDEVGPLPVIESWDTYWKGAQTSAAYTGGGASDPLILQFWNDYFGKLKDRGGNSRIIDIASGNGAVIECASRVFGDRLPEFACLDVSSSAIRMLEKRFPGVYGVVADAAAIPLISARYDVATSQFGVEYAGLEALDEVTRLIAPGGELALLLHHRGGIIYRQCGANLEAVRQMQTARFIPNCIDVFETGYAAIGGGDGDPYREAGKRFGPSIRAMEAIMMRYGREVAAGTILRLYRDVRTIHSRMRHYEPSDVLEWLRKMEHAVEAYAGRMASMREVAIDAERFERLNADLAAKGFEILRAEPLGHPNQELPLAWALHGKRA